MEKLKAWWDGLTPKEKIALVVVTAGVVGYALYIRHKNSQSQSQAPGSTGTSLDQFGNPLVGWDGNIGTGGPPANPGTGTGTGGTGTGTGGTGTGTGGTGTGGTGGTGTGTGGTGGTSGQQFVSVVAWTPTNTPWNSTFSGIARHQGLTIQQLQALNPDIKNIDLLTKGEQIRVA